MSNIALCAFELFAAFFFPKSKLMPTRMYLPRVLRQVSCIYSAFDALVKLLFAPRRSIPLSERVKDLKLFEMEAFQMN